MPVQDVSFKFVIDETGSMCQEIQATKNIVIAFFNYLRQAPVEYTLSPFKDPIPGKSGYHALSCIVTYYMFDAAGTVRCLNERSEFSFVK